MNDSPHPFRASPELKWLLNERAALVGLVKKARERAELLDTKIRRYEQVLAVATEHRAAAERSVTEKTKAIAALDVSISMANAQIRPDAAGCVVPWKGKYGKWGGLSVFLKETLASAAPHPVSSFELTGLARARFGLMLITPSERASFRKCVKKTLWAVAQREGVLERLPSPDSTQKYALYRWKGSSGLDALRSLSGTPEVPEHESAEDSVGGEVAGQRACRRPG